MKKIGAEKKYSSDFISYKIGTVDRKNPYVIYVDGGLFIEPIKANYEYSNGVKHIKKRINCIAEEVASELKLSNNLITNISIADDRLLLNKKTYLSFQMYFRQKNNIEYPVISNLVYDSVKVHMDNIVTDINEVGFLCSKTKK